MTMIMPSSEFFYFVGIVQLCDFMCKSDQGKFVVRIYGENAI